MKKRFVKRIEIYLFLIVLMGASLACNFMSQDLIRLVAEAAMGNCYTVSREIYERSAAHLGQTPETPNYPESAVYEVCEVQGQPSSIRMIDGKNAADEVSEGQKDIPVGTYISEVYANNEPPPGGDDWEYELESEFTITVAEDGTVTGFLIYRYWVDDDAGGCATRSEESITTKVSGFLEGTQGTVILEDHHLNFHEYHGVACGDGREIFKDEENVFEATITVSGDQMDIITSKGQVIYTLIKE